MKALEFGQFILQIEAAPRGKEFMQALLGECLHGKAAFHPESERLTSYNLGRQSIGLMIDNARQAAIDHAAGVRNIAKQAVAEAEKQRKAEGK